MKITASRRDEIIRDRDAFDADRAIRKKRQEEQISNYRAATRKILNSIEHEVEDKLSSIHELQLDVSANFSFKGLEVSVTSNEHDVFNKSKALSWSWKATLSPDTNQVIKESGSWSGLQATTVEQIESLKQSVAALEILNSLNWNKILDKSEPNWADYVEDDPELRKARPDFESQLIEAEIEDAIGKRVLLKCREGAYYKGPVYLGIMSATPKTYNTFEVPVSYVDGILEDDPAYTQHWSSVDKLIDSQNNIRQIRKNKLISILYKPIQSVEY